MVSLDPLPIKEAVEFWAKKLVLSPAKYAALTDEARTLAFGVSGIAKMDELRTVYESIGRAVENGISFDQFKRDCADIFERRGWTGYKGWRIDNIFRTNVQTAYHVGRYRQMSEVVESRPFWKYDAVNDSRTRPTHAAIDGKIYPADHPFWDTWYPPNGFRCRCGVVTLSADEVERDGETVLTDDITGTLIEPVDPVSGMRMPARLLMPDPGFSTNPGKSVYGAIAPKEGPGGTVVSAARDYSDYKRKPAASLPSKAFQTVALSDVMDSATTMASTGVSREVAEKAYADAFLDELGGAGVFADAIGDAVPVSGNMFLDSEGIMRVSAQGGRERYIRLAARSIKTPYEIWLTPMIDERTGRATLARRYFAPFSGAANGYVVFEYATDAWRIVAEFDGSIAGADELRKGVMLYGR